MKMTYEKPFVAVESYALSQAISACATRIGLLNSACVYKDPDAPAEMRALAINDWFTSGNCINVMVNGQSNDGICFHTNANAAFKS